MSLFLPWPFCSEYALPLTEIQNRSAIRFLEGWVNLLISSLRPPGKLFEEFL